MNSHTAIMRLNSQLSKQIMDFANNAEPPLNVYSEEEEDNLILKYIVDLLQKGNAHIHDLGRGIKVSPRSAPALLYKYLIYRMNNLDKYDSETSELDAAFLNQEASDDKVSIRHFYHWLHKNPRLVDEVLNFKDNLAEMIHRGIGLNVKDINSEPHIALTQPSHQEYANLDRLMDSMADLPHSGYGDFQHHMWVPVKDLWYGYPAAPLYAQGMLGHDNEWLVSNTGVRYRASADDVQRSWLSLLNPLMLGNNTAAYPGDILDLPYDHEPIPDDVSLGELEILHVNNRMGEKEFDAYLQKSGDLVFVGNSPFVTRNMAYGIAVAEMERGSVHIAALQNPNLTTGDLVQIVTNPAFMASNDYGQERFTEWFKVISRHTAFSEEVTDVLFDRIVAQNSPNHAVVLARYCPVPIKKLHRFFLGALNDENVTWLPELAVARSFQPIEPVGRTPTAFNNTDVAEQYLNALNYLFTHTDEEADDIYRVMLSGARLSDTVVNGLITDHKAGIRLANVVNMEELITALATRNPFLSPRSMVYLSEIKEGRLGLLEREQLPPDVQVILAQNIQTIEEMDVLVHRSDLTPMAADVILHKIAEWNYVDSDDVSWICRRIARNPNIFMDVLERHLNQEAKKLANRDAVSSSDLIMLSPVQAGIVEGIAERNQNPGGDPLLALPVGVS